MIHVSGISRGTACSLLLLGLLCSRAALLRGIGARQDIHPFLLFALVSCTYHSASRLRNYCFQCPLRSCFRIHRPLPMPTDRLLLEEVGWGAQRAMSQQQCVSLVECRNKYCSRSMVTGTANDTAMGPAAALEEKDWCCNDARSWCLVRYPTASVTWY